MAQPQTSTKPTMQHKSGKIPIHIYLLMLSPNKPTQSLVAPSTSSPKPHPWASSKTATVAPAPKTPPTTPSATLTDGYLSSPYGTDASSQGLRSGDRTCLSASNFASALQAADDGKLSKDAMPKVHLHASQDKALDVVSYKDLKRFATEPEAITQQGRQESHIDPASNQGVGVKESSSIGGDQERWRRGRKSLETECCKS